MIFPTPYAFYQLTEPERQALIGQFFTVPDRPDSFWFPIALTEEGGWQNYNRRQGLIYLSPVLPKYRQAGTWFRVAAFSPDDLDMDLDFDEVGIRDEVRKYLELYVATCPSGGVLYRDVLRDIQSKFKAGVMTS
jgi:hypothetical protein